jgi:methylenetetrahydrofolate reductase (NADPH)
MHILDIFDRHTITFSFEFFPPGSDEAWGRLFERISDFESLAPSFVSVTYGAGGSTRERTHELVVRLRNETRLDPFPHLTTVCQTRSEVERILERYAAAGVSNIVALRGDVPRDMPAYHRSSDEFQHAIDVVRFIRQFNESGRHPDARGFGIGVAGFPEGHPETPNQLVHMDHLKAKVDAGSDYVCTQMFFDNNRFYDWCERCRLAGINVPLVAGIMPIVSIKGMRRMADLAAGTIFPAALQRAIYRCQDDPEAVARVGAHWATEQCRDLIDHGVSGIHFYTLNRSDGTKRIYETLGAKDSAALR